MLSAVPGEIFGTSLDPSLWRVVVAVVVGAMVVMVESVADGDVEIGDSVVPSSIVFEIELPTVDAPVCMVLDVDPPITLGVGITVESVIGARVNDGSSASNIFRLGFLNSKIMGGILYNKARIGLDLATRSEKRNW